ncbi:MAG: chromosome segregation protein SMC, partial [Oscillospiraceae bacterium]|nr:chromosome segregation protein SMC [Oscillospiraceae bacterium]
MYFKTMEIQGFKSFPDKTVLAFDNRTTAVVGSNGNGKSNISDALRWVMGEQGAKTLRGDKMEDVIFFGTQTRKPMGFAKVALTIDNSDRCLAIDSDEVVITRKLYRTGDSEYLINGAKSRLKDVHTLFMGTGLGRDGYSIIGQGRIDEIVNLKASGRRELFEEAAGVSKFLYRKAASERELEKTEENLLRLLDIELSLQARIPVLEKQAGKAKIARDLLEEEKALSVTLAVHESEQIQKDVAEADNAVLMNLGECEHFDREINELESEADEIGEKKQEVFAKTDSLRRAAESDRDEVAAVNTEIEVMKTNIANNNGRVCAVREQITTSLKSGEEIIGQIAELESGIEAVEREISEIEKSVENENKSLSELDEQNASLDEQNREVSREIGEMLTAKSAAEIYISRGEATVEDLESQLRESESAIAGQAGEKSGLEAKLSGLRAESDELTELKQETANKLSGYSRLYESKTSKRDEAREVLDKLKQDEHQKKTRLDILTGIEQSLEGYYPGVKAAVAAAKSGRFGRSFCGAESAVHGIIADIIKVPSEYATAVEIALGSVLQHIVVANESVAKRC